MSHRQKIGSQLKALREKAGITQSEMAEKTGLQRANIARVEGGKYNTGIDIIQKICTVLCAEIELKKPLKMNGSINNK
jgi:transcriptional regulator with XRE-family HTH domain